MGANRSSLSNARVAENQLHVLGVGVDWACVVHADGSIQQTLTELTMLAAGPAALPYVREGDGTTPDVPWLSDEAFRFASGHYFNFRKTTIYGGSNEIQRNIIAQHVFGL